MKLAVVNAGTGDPSSTRLLADRTAQRVAALAEGIDTHVIDLREIATEVTTAPTALFAAPEDWADPALTGRIDRAALELVTLMQAGVTATIRSGDAAKYQTQFGSPNDPGIRLDSDLMRLAAGGRRSSPHEGGV